MRCSSDTKDGKTVHAGRQVAVGVFAFDGQLCVHAEADPDGEGDPIARRALLADHNPAPVKAPRGKKKK